MDNTGVWLLAVVGGIAIAIQGQFMGIMTETLGPRESIFITYAGGALLSVLMILAAEGGNLSRWRTVPWYVLTAGVFGLTIIGTIGYVIPRLGLSTGFGVIVASQFICGAVIDQLGLFGAEMRPIDLPKLLGLGLIVGGVALTGR